MKEYEFRIYTSLYGEEKPMGTSRAPLSTDLGGFCSALRFFFGKGCIIEFEEVEIEPKDGK